MIHGRDGFLSFALQLERKAQENSPGNSRHKAIFAAKSWQEKELDILMITFA